MYDEVPYVEGLNMCLWLLDKCDEMWVFGDYTNSTGCMGEIAYCKNHRIPYKIFTDCKCYKDNIGLDCLSCILSSDDDEGIYCELGRVSKILRKELTGGF